MTEAWVDLTDDGAIIQLPLGEIAFDGQGGVHVIGPTAEATVRDASFQAGATVRVWIGSECSFFLGLRGQLVYVTRPRETTVAIACELTRLDLHNRYDPGGLYSVSFVGLPDQDVLLVYEYGAVYLSCDGMRWHLVHNDLTAHFSAIEHDLARFDTDTGVFYVNLADGNRIEANPSSGS